MLSLKDENGQEVRNLPDILNIIQTFYENLYESSTIHNPIKRKVVNVCSEEVPDIEVCEIQHALRAKIIKPLEKIY